MNNNVFITGVASGLGEGLACEYLDRERHVFGLSRHDAGIDSEYFHPVVADLGDLDGIDAALDQQLADAEPSLAILGAGVNGDFKTLPNVSLDQLRRAMDINVWANKRILDWFAAHKAPGQIVVLSATASVDGSKGWAIYSLSSAALNMLTQLYAESFPASHLSALAADGVFASLHGEMNEEVDTREFWLSRQLDEARGTGDGPSPPKVARRITESLDSIKKHCASGAYVDIRDL